MSPDNVSVTDVHMTVAARAENVAVVRQVVAALTETLHLPRPVCEDVRIAVTEACGNVVRHAYAGGPGPMSVALRDGDGELRVEVLDRGVGIGFDAPEGLGLPLIA